MWVLSLSQEDSLEKEMATHSSILAWETPWTEEPAGLKSLGGKDQRGLSTAQGWAHFIPFYAVGLWGSK